jgi:hypothetical protein
MQRNLFDRNVMLDRLCSLVAACSIYI